ncbi:MAG: Ig-like domain-containing protein, partial [Bacteroidales bacterium]|nr:Ig-like domain-containing protein [Bacteroidales bacterium]
PNLEQTVEGERVMNLSRYDVDRDGAFSLADLTLLANALVGRVNYPITNLTLSSSAISLLKNGGAKLTATLLPADADLTALSWTTSNHLVATVDATGNVIGRSAGTCTITARTLDGSNLSATCQVMVVDPSGTASDYVDLGLPSGTLWAACNLGATKPEEYGDYYAWGETTPYSDEGKTEFSWATYKYCNGSEKSLTKYCTNSTYCDGTMDNLSELELADDVAHVVKGGYWRMPSTEQCAELIDSRYTTHAWSEMNGVNGMLITSIVPGYEGNSIFLPAAGKHTNVWYTDVNASGSYWGRTLSETAPSVADGLFFGSGYLRVFRWSTIEGYRCCGNAIRPVWSE